MHLLCSSIFSFIQFTSIFIMVDGYSKAPPRLASTKSKSNPVIFLAGSKVSLQCPVYADPQHVIIEWLRDNVPVDHIHRYFVTLNGYLKIEFAQIEDSGVYTCKAVNGFGSVDANITLSILSERELNERRFTSVGDTRTYHNHHLNINHNNININNLNHQNTINSNNNNNNHNMHYINSFNGNTNNLNYGNLRAENEDTIDPVGQFDSDSDYDDLESPYFLTPLTTKVIKKNIGKPLRLRCHVSGKPRPEIIWYKNGSPISLSAKPSLRSRSNEILDFQEARLEDSGYYMCVATNPKGQINATFSVTITDRENRPEIIGIAPGNRTVLLGQTTWFECQFTSRLEPVVKWLKEVTIDELEENPDGDRGILIEIDGEYYKSLKDNSHVSKRDGIFYHRLVIDSVDRDDSGKYVCSVVNYKGYTYHASYLMVSNAVELNQHRGFGLQDINYCTISIAVLVVIGFIALIIVFIFFLIENRGRRGGGNGALGLAGGGIRGRGKRLIDPAADPAKYPILEERYHPSCYHHHVKHLQPPTPTPTSTQQSSTSNNNVVQPQSTTVTSASASHNKVTPSASYSGHYLNQQNKLYHHYSNGSTDYQRSFKDYQKITNAIIHDQSSSPSTIRSLGVI